MAPLKPLGPLRWALLLGLLVSLSPGLFAPTARAAEFSPLAPTFGSPHTVTYDRYSLMIDGQRVAIWAGEFHMFRLPSPQLWRDVLEKMRAGGYNAVSIYVDWAYQSPTPGVYDFSGIRDVGRLLTMAEQAGLYVIFRPGPYINAELDSGGFPGWLAERAGPARTSAPDYTQAWQQYLSALDPIVARHQITRGGSVILYQIENELVRTENETPYMQALVAKVHADGITVPTDANLIVGPGWTGVTDLSGPDDYPQGFNCSSPQTWSSQIGLQLDNLATNTAVDSPGTPGFIPEFQGGAFDPWGGTGYSNCYQLTNGPFQRVINDTATAQGVTMRNAYMAYGGTSWGWQAVPSDYSSYDYGAAINEARELTPKFYDDKRLAYAAQALAPLTKTTSTGKPPGSNADLLYARRENPDTHTQFVFLRHSDPTSTAVASTTLSLSTPDGTYPRVPQQPGSEITVHGRDMKMLVADLDLNGAAHLVYSTSQLMTHARIGSQEALVLYGTSGDSGETVLRYAAKPTVSTLQGSVSSTWDAARGDLRLDYGHGGLTRLLVSSPRGTLLLVIDSQQDAGRIWLTDTPQGPVLSYGSYLIRSAEIRGGVLGMRGDTSASFPTEGQLGGATDTSAWSGDLSRAASASPLVVLAAPQPLRGVTFNGSFVDAAPQAGGALAGSVPGPPAVSLPALAGWRFAAETPEAQPAFDDSHWTAAAKLVADSPVQQPAVGPVLDMDDYGFHYGNVWYRGHFTALGTETGIRLDCETGGGPSTCSVWLNGHFLSTTATQGPQTVSFPTSELRVGQANVVSVLAENDGHPEDFATATEQQKLPRGLGTAVVLGSAAPVIWRIQGTLGGDHPADLVHGPLNNGGLYGERAGWYQPGFNDSAWGGVTLPDRWSSRGVPPGVGWYRTTFALSLPAKTDIPIGLHFADAATQSYEALIFLNGWMVGRYANDLGPQHLFYLPAGALDQNGRNTLAIAVLSHGAAGSGGGLGTVSLQAYGRYAGGVDTGVSFAPPGHPFVCARPSGRLAGVSLGPVKLGMKRRQARSRFARVSLRGRRYMDFFCPARGGIRVGYPSPGLLRSVARSERRRLRGRAVVVLTSNRHYALRGVRPGARLTKVARRLRAGRGFHVGRNTWYLVPSGSRLSRGVLKVQHGRIAEIGIADPRFARGRRAGRVFFRSFS
ncbi:MAG: beta-galactosidase [Solirubrobacteraceae bacterium]